MLSIQACWIAATTKGGGEKGELFIISFAQKKKVFSTKKK